MSIIPSILITIEKSIAENGVVLKQRTMQLTRDIMIQKAPVIVIAKDSFGKNSAIENVTNIMR